MRVTPMGGKLKTQGVTTRKKKIRKGAIMTFRETIYLLEQIVHWGQKPVTMSLLEEGQQIWEYPKWLIGELDVYFELSPQKLNSVLQPLRVPKYSKTGKYSINRLVEMANDGTIEKHVEQLTLAHHVREHISSMKPFPVPIRVELEDLEPAGAVGGDN